MNKKIIAGILSLVLICSASAQIAQEKTVELTGKSKNKGYLGNVVVDDAKQQFDMVFVTKDNNRKIKFDVYQFDYNLNLLNNFSDEQEVKNANSKYKWFKYKGDGENDVEMYEGITAEQNMLGKLILKKMQTIKKFNWWTGNYEYETKQLDKVKPTTMDEDGKKRKLYYLKHQEISSSGELLALTLENKGMKAMLAPERNYLLLRFNKDLQIAEETPLPFTSPQNLIFAGSIAGTDPNEDLDAVYVFAPAKFYNKIDDPIPTNFTYVRVAPGGKIINRFNFQSKCNNWAIMDVAQNGNDIFLYGAGYMDKPEKNYSELTITAGGLGAIPMTDETRETIWEEKKYSHLQIMKITDGKLSFVNAVSVDDVNAKSIKPPSQKKMYEFDGKRFVLNSINITGSGDIFIDGQDFKNQKPIGSSYAVRVFQDLLMFQFDKDGNFKRFYGIENTAKNRLRPIANAKAVPSRSFLIESPDKKNLIWNVFFVKDVDEDCSLQTSTFMNTTTTTTTCYYTPLFQGKIGNIDIESGNISDFKLYGGEDFYLYMDFESNKGNKDGYFEINGGKQFIFLARQRKGGFTGTERWGSSVWFGKFDPTKQ